MADFIVTCLLALAILLFLALVVSEVIFTLHDDGTPVDVSKDYTSDFNRRVLDREKS